MEYCDSVRPDVSRRPERVVGTIKRALRRSANKTGVRRDAVID